MIAYFALSINDLDRFAAGGMALPHASTAAAAGEEIPSRSIT
jgi:hypothetical protein